LARSCALALKRNYEPVIIICAHLLTTGYAYAPASTYFYLNITSFSQNIEKISGNLDGGYDFNKRALTA
jgi:hypothetical protein